MEPPPRKLLDQLPDAIRLKHYSYRTKQTDVQESLRHKDVKTTMIDTHVLNRGGRGVRSPLDTHP